MKASADIDDHRRAAAWHARRRFLERYGMPLSDDGLAEIERKIVTGEAVRVRRRGPGYVWLVEHAGIVAFAVVNDELGCVVTFLPRRRDLPKRRPA